MATKFDFLTKELAIRAAEEIDRSEIPRQKYARNYVVLINNKEYPFKMVVRKAAELAGAPLNNFGSSEYSRSIFREKTGIEIEQLTETADKSKMNRFQQVIEELIELLENDDSVLADFQFRPATTGYVWIEDHTGEIGDARCHYELRNTKSNNIAIHFEGTQAQKDIFHQRIKELPEGVKWVKWYNSKSLALKRNVDVNSPNAAKDFQEGLLQLEELIGEQVREVLKLEPTEQVASNNSSSVEHPLNQIMYGPPGTGKTFHSINRALEIIGKDKEGNVLSAEQISNLDRKAVKELFDHYLEEGRIVFTTFHQSMSYEDFVEGIKPQEPKAEDSPVSYLVEDGIFKKTCNDAKGKLANYTAFDDVYEQLKEMILEQDDFELKTLVKKKPFRVRINSSGSCVVIPKTELATEMTITKAMVRDYLYEGKIRDWKPYLTSIGDFIVKTFDFKVESTVAENEPYVLIIDEINRGNVSSIFGELITLIEKDKRLGGKEELKLTLPYSKGKDGKFGVPANVHIIGTMNTADRSVEALDTALRRRFTFVEMPPEYEKLQEKYLAPNGILKENSQEFNLIEIHKLINQRIEVLLDRDHLIGHSYFMNVKSLNDLKASFAKQIIPLLQEYFYGDYGKIALVLGEGFCSGETITDASKIFANSKHYDVEAYSDKVIYNLANVMDSEFNIASAIDKLLCKPTSTEL